MSSLAEMFVALRPDGKGFQPEADRIVRRTNLDKSGRQLGLGLSKSLGAGMRIGIGGAFKAAIAPVAAAAAGLGVANFLKGAVAGASELNETMSKSASVFGPANREILLFASTSAKALGQSKQEAIAAAAQFGNMFNQLGIGQKPAARMSTQMVKLASDFASFHNADISDVLEAQQAAFRGEFDSIQRFVPTINAAAVEQEGLRLKLAGSSKELTAQDKALATQSLLMRGAGKAVGDFSRTSGGLANQQRILTAQFADFKAGLGDVLLPVVTKFFTFLNTYGVPVLKEISGGFQAFSAAFQANDGDITSSGFPGFMERLAFAARQAFDYFKTNVLPRLREFATYVRDTVIPIVVQLAKEHLAKLQVLFNKVRDAIRDNRPQLQQLWNGLVAVAKVVIEKIIPFLYRLSSNIFPVLGTAISIGIRWVSRLVDAFNAIKGPVFSAIKFITEKFLGFVGAVLTGAAKAFGWVPKLGPKLKTAAADFEQFKKDVNRSLDNIDDEAIKVALSYSAKGINLSAPSHVSRTGMAAGGSVHGPGTGTSDQAGLYALSNGEHVITAREVRGAGGHRAIEAMRSQWRGMARGGRVFDVATSLPSQRNIDNIASATARKAGTDVAAQVARDILAGGAGGPVSGFRGVRLDALTIRRLLSAERMLGRVFRIMQGSYSTSVAASGGTHAGGGAMDTDNAGAGWSAAVRALRRAGFASWHRTPAQGPWGHHIHSIAIGDTSASAAAKAQVRDFLRGGDGLGGGGGTRRAGRVQSYDRGGYLPPGLSMAYNGTGKPEPVGGGVSLAFTNCTFAGTSKREFTDLVVGAVDEAKRKRRL